MAQSISDVFARGEKGEENARRTARFLGPKGRVEKRKEINVQTGVETIVPEGPVRRAAFRPAEDIALRRDVVDAFAAARLQDGAAGRDLEGGYLLDAALGAEALAEQELAFQHLRSFDRQERAWQWEDVFLKHRVLRFLGSEDLLSRALKESADLCGAPGWAGLYSGLERAALGWEGGMEAQRIRRRVERAVRSAPSRAEADVFALLWAMQLYSDASLEHCEPEEALRGLEEALTIPSLNSEVRQALEGRRAVWLHVFGRHEEARSRLDELASRGGLPGDLDDLLVHLTFEAGDRERAFQVLRSNARDKSRLKTHALPLVMLHDGEGEVNRRGRDILREATEEQDDWTLLRLREQLLESVNDETGRGVGSELIDVLNRRLEGPLTPEERVNLLTRLGRLYEEEASLEEAAAEVYREALSYDPRHVPALRALGRLYTRRENWRGLAELYEREIASREDRESSWRRHFQLAELYEHRLQKDERALENYLIVLETKPNYLPALKSSARILGRLERWTRLADLFLRMVETAPSRRQKLYLLDKVAEVAEHRLENLDVAIGAWREILDLDSENPRAYTALGRLLSRSGRWEELIALNEAETELIEDDEEVAAAHLRNAEIAEQQMEDLELAERFYRRTLEVIPDYLPALEALGRIYLRGSRWAEIVSMTGRELRTVAQPEKATRQLSALAEILETRLDRRADAIAIYEELRATNPLDLYVFTTLCRLYRSEGAYDKLEALMLERLSQSPPLTEFVSLHGELALIAEWKSGQVELAFGRYLSALQGDPTNLHWLEGVARTWPAAGASPAKVADSLEDLLMHARDEEVRDRYFLTIARLRERAEGSSEASRAYRAHGDSRSLENQIVLRLAMATAGERLALTCARRAVPHFPMQEAMVAERCGNVETLVTAMEREKAFLPDNARAWLAGQLPAPVARVLDGRSTLRLDLLGIMEGETLYSEETEEIQEGARRRLRGLQARQQGAHQAYFQWTEEEIAESEPSVRAARLLELARYSTAHAISDEETCYARACRVVFPELKEEQIEESEQIEIAFEYPPISEDHRLELFEALRKTKRWGWLRRCLEAMVARPGLVREERLELFEELASVLREKLDDYLGARDALVHCWQLSEDPRFLRELVKLAVEHKERDDALRFQRRHFEHLSGAQDTLSADRIQSGIWLADLLLLGDEEDDLDAGIECLEHLSSRYHEEEGVRTVRRMLARAHGKVGNGRRAVELFEGVLHFQVRGDEIEDWRLLVELLREQLHQPEQAYIRQWTLVRAFPDSQIDLDVLVDLAGEAGELADCVEQLSQLASATTSDGKVALLARAAEAADEELGHAEEAYRLFERVLELTGPDHERRLYYERRRAVCLARMAGREAKALEAFRELLEREPFEPANFRGMETLFARAGALDRLRVTRQSLRMLGCGIDEVETKGKVHPTRTLNEGVLEQGLLPKGLGGGVLEVLRMAMPLADKIWTEMLPQRKAFDGRRIKPTEEPGFYKDLQAALLAFGLTRFKLYVGESGPEVPMVFSESTPVVWVHETLLEKLSAAESRFVAGYCAALIYSDLASLTSLDGRQVWHLIEGIVYRQTGRGFSERIDLQSQDLAEMASGPFDGACRKRVQRAVEALGVSLADCHCEAWGRDLEIFAARAGLLLSGDLAAATQGLLRLGGWSLPLEETATQRRIRNDDTIADLVRLAHSDEYLELRYRLGLAGRPSRLKI